MSILCILDFYGVFTLKLCQCKHNTIHYDVLLYHSYILSKVCVCAETTYKTCKLKKKKAADKIPIFKIAERNSNEHKCNAVWVYVYNSNVSIVVRSAADLISIENISICWNQVQDPFSEAWNFNSSQNWPLQGETPSQLAIGQLAPYSQHTIFFVTAPNKLECYITVGCKGLPWTNTLAY